jgi:O-antigen/teichoic acid export membrane protein
VVGLVAFALQARLLPAPGPGLPSPFGQYLFASLVWLYANTITDWGLGTWLTRELAAHRGDHTPEQARRLFAQTLGLRLALSLLALLPLGALALSAAGRATFQITDQGTGAILLLGLALIPGAFAGSVTALYNAYERMGPPAAVQVVSVITTTVLGIAALLLGLGAPGLAAAALISTCGQAPIFDRLMRRDFFAPALALDPAAARAVLTTTFPLMLNSLLVTIFFRFDQPIIQSYHPDQVPVYEAAYKVINVTQIIAPSVVLALFPGMARAALSDRGALIRQYRMAVKFLLLLGLPMMVGTAALADWIMRIITLGKEGYLPWAAWALAILIGYLPLSFINGVLTYVLIALGRQSRITWAIGATALFNVGVNLWAVPAFGMYGAAVVTVLSEVVLLGPFVIWTGRELGADAVRPGRAGVWLAAAGAVLAVGTAAGVALGLPAVIAQFGGIIGYAGVVAGGHILHGDERARLRGQLRRS